MAFWGLIEVPLFQETIICVGIWGIAMPKGTAAARVLAAQNEQSWVYIISSTVKVLNFFDYCGKSPFPTLLPSREIKMHTSSSQHGRDVDGEMLD